jgi:hypothetical protein
MVERLNPQLEPLEIAAGEWLRASLFLLGYHAVMARVENEKAMLKEER